MLSKGSDINPFGSIFSSHQPKVTLVSEKDKCRGIY